MRVLQVACGELGDIQGCPRVGPKHSAVSGQCIGQIRPEFCLCWSACARFWPQLSADAAFALARIGQTWPNMCQIAAQVARSWSIVGRNLVATLGLASFAGGILPGHVQVPLSGTFTGCQHHSPTLWTTQGGPTRRRLAQRPRAASAGEELATRRASIPCKYGRHCANQGCMFRHDPP